MSDPKKHIITMVVTVTMEDMDGTPEESAEIAFEQVSSAMEGKESVYGWPGEADVEVTHFHDMAGFFVPFRGI